MKKISMMSKNMKKKYGFGVLEVVVLVVVVIALAVVIYSSGSGYITEMFTEITTRTKSIQ